LRDRLSAGPPSCARPPFPPGGAKLRSVEIRIEGYDPPGREFSCDGVERDNVHVALQVDKEPFGLVPGDTEDAAWSVDVRVVPTTGGLDLRGPAVHGKRGERFLYLTWGHVTPTGGFEMFRRAKLMVDDIEPGLLRAAAESAGGGLAARVELRDAKGHPRCARVKAPAITWSGTGIPE
jgi:hypothetical protein